MARLGSGKLYLSTGKVKKIIWIFSASTRWHGNNKKSHFLGSAKEKTAFDKRRPKPLEVTISIGKEKKV